MTDNLGGAPFVSAGDFSVPLSMVHSFDSESEEALGKRFTNRWTGKQEDLVFEFSRDAALLHQYHLIHQEQFKIVHNAQRFRSAEIEHDGKGHIMVVRRGNFCVGGARIAIKTPRSPELLPMEISEFRLENHFSSLQRKQARYGQLFGFSLLPEFRGGDVTLQMFHNLYRKVVALNLDMVFAAAPILNARAYKKSCTAMGLKDVKIHLDIELPSYPTYEEIKLYLVSGAIDKSRVDVRPDLVTEEEFHSHEEV